MQKLFSTLRNVLLWILGAEAAVFIAYALFWENANQMHETWVPRYELFISISKLLMLLDVWLLIWLLSESQELAKAKGFIKYEREWKVTAGLLNFGFLLIGASLALQDQVPVFKIVEGACFGVLAVFIPLITLQTFALRREIHRKDSSNG